MRDIPKKSLRASSWSKDQVTVNRGGDVTSYRVGRTHAQGETRDASGHYRIRHRPLKEHLVKLGNHVCGTPLDATQAEDWARKMRYGLK